MNARASLESSPPAELSSFFAQMRELLLASAAPPDPNLAYYRTLVWRNYDKILGDVFASSRAAICSARAEPGHGRTLWDECVRAYAMECPRAAHDPNEFARAFPDWISRQAARLGEPLSSRLGELADLHWTLHLCGIAPPLADHASEDLEQRIFIRQYSFDVVGWRKALESGARSGQDLAALATGDPHFFVCFRHLRSQRVEILRASLAELQVLAASAGIVPPSGTQLSESLSKPARIRLARLGVLRPPTEIPKLDA